MIDEVFLNGFCRAQNAGRMVDLEYEENGGQKTLENVDCSYGRCDFQGSCEIARQIERILNLKG